MPFFYHSQDFIKPFTMPSITDDPYWDPYWATQLRGDQIDYPNSLPANMTSGFVRAIELEWDPKAESSLRRAVRTYRIRNEKLKAMTEHYAYQVADERNKSYVLIM
jgi:hypothetical protein